MTEAQTIAYICCRYRRYGCNWIAKIPRAVDEYTAQRAREVHHLVCSYRHHAPPSDDFDPPDLTA